MMKHIVFGLLLALPAAVTGQEGPAQPGMPAAVDTLATAGTGAGEAGTPRSDDIAALQISVGGLIQAWFGSATVASPSSFRLRRAEIRFSGELDEHTQWTLMLDPAKVLTTTSSQDTLGGTPGITNTRITQSSRLLQDAFVTLRYGAVQLSAGQLKLPLGLESQISSAKLEAIERARFMTDKSRGGNLADVRDLGLILRAAPLPHSTVQLGVFNGAGESMGSADDDDAKFVVGRATTGAIPIMGLQLGASGATQIARTGPRRDRLGLELNYVHPNVSVRAETMHAWEGGIHRAGSYAQLSYRWRDWTPLLRWDTWDPDRGSEETSLSASARDLIAGASWDIRHTHARLQANYIHRTVGNRSEPLFVLNLQAAW